MKTTEGSLGPATKKGNSRLGIKFWKDLRYNKKEAEGRRGEEERRTVELEGGKVRAEGCKGKRGRSGESRGEQRRRGAGLLEAEGECEAERRWGRGRGGWHRG
jgi:hypothetical protein